MIFVILTVMIVESAIQYATGFWTTTVDGLIVYGLPFTFYEYVPMFDSGRIMYFGLIGDVLVALIFGASLKFLADRT